MLKKIVSQGSIAGDSPEYLSRETFSCKLEKDSIINNEKNPINIELNCLLFSLLSVEAEINRITKWLMPKGWYLWVLFRVVYM